MMNLFCIQMRARCVLVEPLNCVTGYRWNYHNDYSGFQPQRRLFHCMSSGNGSFLTWSLLPWNRKKRKYKWQIQLQFMLSLACKYTTGHRLVWNGISAHIRRPVFTKWLSKWPCSSIWLEMIRPSHSCLDYYGQLFSVITTSGFSLLLCKSCSKWNRNDELEKNMSQSKCSSSCNLVASVFKAITLEELLDSTYRSQYVQAHATTCTIWPKRNEMLARHQTRVSEKNVGN